MTYVILSVLFFLSVLFLNLVVSDDRITKKKIILNYILIFSFFLIPISIGIREMEADLKLFKSYVEAGYTEDSNGKWVLEAPLEK